VPYKYLDRGGSMAIWNETVSFYLIRFGEFAMPGWDEASVDELMADPIVRDLMAADGVDPIELRALLYGVQRTIERYATSSGGPASLAGFANRDRSDVRKTPIALAGHSRSSISPLACMFGGKTACTARS
jgi:hypothetical protein